MTSDPLVARPGLILASASPRRLALLQQLDIEPTALLPADLDETPRRNEAPRSLAARLAAEKAAKAIGVARHRADLVGSFILAADTVVCVGRRILPKCETTEEAVECLRLISGRAHRVFTGVTVIAPVGTVRHRLVETRVRFKRLSTREIDSYLSAGEWKGKAGGYAIQGRAAAFVIKIIGSHSSVIGLPLYETTALLDGLGFNVFGQWSGRELSAQRKDQIL